MDHYAALGVSPNAGNAELNNAFKRKTNALNPTSNNNLTRRHTALRNVSVARKALKNSYNLLKNKERRNKYNKTRKTLNQNSKAIDYTYVIEKLSSPPQYGSMVGYAKFDITAINRLEEKINALLNKKYKLYKYK
jgi:curved DNA-binding protein CbpA